MHGQKIHLEETGIESSFVCKYTIYSIFNATYYAIYRVYSTNVGMIRNPERYPGAGCRISHKRGNDSYRKKNIRLMILVHPTGVGMIRERKRKSLSDR